MTMMRAATGGSRDAKMVAKDKRVGPKVGSTTRVSPAIQTLPDRPRFFLRFSRFGLTSVLFPLLDLDARAGSRVSFPAALSLHFFLVWASACTPTPERLGLNTRRRGSIPRAPLPYPVRLADCSRGFRPDMLASILRRCATSTSSACGLPLGPAPHLSLSLLPPSFALTPSTSSLFLVSLLPPRLTARCQPTAQPRRSINPAGVVCPRAQPVQIHARPCSAGSNLPVRCLAPAIGSAHGLAIQQARTSPPILPSSFPLFPSHLNPPCTARLWTFPSLKWPTLDPTSSIRPHALHDWPRSM
jgi:hypothetical protein